MKKTNRSGWFEALAHSAQMFRGSGKGMGRGRGPRLASAPAFAATERREAREGVFTEAA